jgi:hypothetical protein
MIELPAWRDVAVPRDDIQDGSFDESSFAADLGLAAAGQGRPEYRDARLFFEQTYLTSNLAVVLDELIRRVDGDSAAAGVYRMQTEFGGGKTHTLLSAYHLFRSPGEVIETACGQDLAARTGRTSFPSARVVVLDGSAMLAGQPTEFEEGVVAHTLLGHLAYGLGGAEALARVADQDAALLGSGTTQLSALLRDYAPCVIVLDEALEYLVKALPVRTNEGDLATTTLTLIKELSTAVAGVEKVALLATLTSSRPESYSEEGERLLESLQKVVGRQENVVTPVEGDDIFPILARRLFITQGEEATRRQVADAYANYYVADLADSVPSAYRETGFRERIVAAYPFHPDLVDLLQNRWGSLSGFQRTRGALRLLGHTVKALWLKNAQAPLIHLGDVDLADAGVRGEVLKVTGESYKSALNEDIIRSDAQAPTEDRRRGGQAQELKVATSLATAAFLYSFGPDRVLGGSQAQMLAGVARPGLGKGLVDDVRDSLRELLWYSRVEGGRFRFTTEPNLNKVILEREGAIGEDRIAASIYDALRTVAPGTKELRVIPRIVDSGDLPDEAKLTLGVLDLDHRIGPNETDDTLRHAEQVLLYRGSAGRANKNSAMLVAADAAALTRAKNTARTLAAIGDVKADKARYNRLNQEQKDELDTREAATADRLPDHVVMAFRHLLMLVPGGNSGLQLLHDDLGPAAADTRLDERVTSHLLEADRLITGTLAPAALLTDRFGVFAADSDDVALEDLRAYFARHPQLPKLGSTLVLQNCISRGVRDGVFGIAQGATWNAADSVLRIDTDISADEVQFQPGVFLVKAGAIREEIAKRARMTPAPIPTPEPGATQPAGGDGDEPTLPVECDPTGGETASGNTRVSLRLTGVPADRARDVLKVAILPLATAGATVSVDMQITASSDNGIPGETLDLTVVEGLRQLGIDFEIDTK